MDAVMTHQERTLLSSFLVMSDNYVEFGSGGSTVMACQNVRRSVLSVDSDQEWIDKVKAECALKETPVQPEMVHIDIGKIGEWGYPIGQESRLRWARYHEAIWQDPRTSDADLFFVDGRFRVACFIQALLHAGPRALILMHDFSDRPDYHVVRRFAREIAVAEKMSVFQRHPNMDCSEMVGCLQEHRNNPV